MFFKHFLLCILVAISGVFSKCPSEIITTSDIQLAWKAANFAYDAGSVTGAYVPGTNARIVAHGEDEIIDNRTPVKVFVAEDDKTTIIAYRGTMGKSQLQDQFSTIVRNFGGKKVTIGGKQATIIKYFWLGYKELYDNIKPYLDRKDHRYIITGHSLGGSMASIMSVMALEEGHSVWNHPKSSLITFGQPRTGDEVYAKTHDKMIDGFRKLRFTNRNDLITQLPLPLNPPAWHHSQEIWMAKQLQIYFWRTPKVYWKVCDKGDAWGGSFQRALAPSVNDHMPAEYNKYVMKLPPLYYDENSGKHKSFRRAFVATCS